MQRASHRDYFTFLGFLFIYYDFLSVPALLILTYAGRPDIQYRTYEVDFHVRPLGKVNQPGSPPCSSPTKSPSHLPNYRGLRSTATKSYSHVGIKVGSESAFRVLNSGSNFVPILHPPIRWVAFPLTSPPTCSIALLHQ